MIVLLTIDYNNDLENNRHITIKIMSNIDEKWYFILSISTDSATVGFFLCTNCQT
jgi:hypothetical protein